jgi:hypothetical protein
MDKRKREVEIIWKTGSKTAMKLKLTILFVFFFYLGNAQDALLKEAVSKLDVALVTKDTIALKKLLHSDLNYGHSNGWVETKTDVINDLLIGKLLYTKIESSDFKWVADKEIASVRSTAKINFVLNNTPGELNLHVLQIWKKTGDGWQLYARQSTKL